MAYFVYGALENSMLAGRVKNVSKRSKNSGALELFYFYILKLIFELGLLTVLLSINLVGLFLIICGLRLVGVIWNEISCLLQISPFLVSEY